MISAPNRFPPADGTYNLHITVQAHPTATVMQVSGELEMLTAPQLDQALTAVQADAPPVLVVDLTAVTFLASSGLAVLAAAHDRAAQHDTRVRVVAANHVTRRPIEICGLDQVIAVFPDLTAALNAS